MIATIAALSISQEMTYIPLDRDGKTKGKAAIDVLGARLGKSGTKLLPRIGFYRMLYLSVHIDS